MAESFYRLCTDTEWSAESGNALLALYNKPGSGKRIKIHSLEVYNFSMQNDASTTYSNVMKMALGRVTHPVISRVTTTPMKLDSSAGNWPSEIVIGLGGSVEPTGTNLTYLMRKNLLLSTTTQAPMLNIGRIGKCGDSFGAVWSAQRNSNLEKIIIRPGESAALYSLDGFVSIPVTVDVTLQTDIAGTLRTYVARGIVYLGHTANQAIVTISNSHASTKVRVLDIRISELGTPDTPYLQVVPVGLMDVMSLTDQTRIITNQVVTTDSATTNLSSSICDVFTNVPIYPFGVPMNYLAQASAGSPRGFNYLNTKDFLGPTFLNMLVEQAGVKNPLILTAPGTLGTQNSMQLSRAKGFKAPLVLREGEGLAIVSAAESATVATPVSVAGMSCLNFSLGFSVGNAFTPYLTLSGLKTNSEVRIFNAGTTTELAFVEDSGMSFSWQYDYSLYSAVDIVIHHLSYEYILLTNISLPTSGVTIPIQQRVDRQFLNP
jgi:hypothetical protein